MGVAEAPAPPYERRLGDLEPNTALLAGAAAVVALMVSAFVAGLGGRVLRHLHYHRDGLAGPSDLVVVGDPFDAGAYLDLGFRLDAVDGVGYLSRGSQKSSGWGCRSKIMVAVVLSDVFELVVDEVAGDEPAAQLDGERRWGPV